MSSIGANPTTIAASGCGMPPALPRPGSSVATAIGRPAGSTVGAAFALPTTAAPAAMPMERFAHSAAGGVIVGKDGAPAGRIPAGSFVDVKAGTIFGADGKAITIPEGATVDFFDLPDLAVMRASANATAATPTAEGGGSTTAPAKTEVDGQWGPGGVTPIKSGATPPSACGMDHGPATKAGGATTTGTTVAATSSNPTVNELNKLIETLQKQVTTLQGSTTAGGATAVAGASSLGSTASLNSALTDLVAAIRELGESIRLLPTTGGGPGQKAPTQPPTQLPPNISPPRTELPPTQVPPTTPSTPASSGSAGTGSSDTVAPASGSSSS